MIFPVLHGTFGEDGTIQGLFELADLAYVGAGVLGSAVGMDKALFKDVMRANGLPVVEFDPCHPRRDRAGPGRRSSPGPKQAGRLPALYQTGQPGFIGWHYQVPQPLGPV